jgi:hypothetical protein
MHAGTAAAVVVGGPEVAIEFLLLLGRQQGTHPRPRL